MAARLLPRTGRKGARVSSSRSPTGKTGARGATRATGAVGGRTHRTELHLSHHSHLSLFATPLEIRRRHDLNRAIDAAVRVLDVHVGLVRIAKVEIETRELRAYGAVGNPAPDPFAGVVQVPVLVENNSEPDVVVLRAGAVLDDVHVALVVDGEVVGVPERATGSRTGRQVRRLWSREQLNDGGRQVEAVCAAGAVTAGRVDVRVGRVEVQQLGAVGECLDLDVLRTVVARCLDRGIVSRHAAINRAIWQHGGDAWNRAARRVGNRHPGRGASDRGAGGVFVLPARTDKQDERLPGSN